MKNSKTIYGTIFSLLVAGILCLVATQAIFCQTETLDIISYTPPKGWAKTVKEGAVVYTDINKSTNAFCLLTVYSSTASAGSPPQDFANDWKEFVVRPFNAEANPKTQVQTTPDGWQATVGGTNIELDGGVKAAAILTVFSGFGKTASVLAIFNNESYSAQVSALIDGIKLDKTRAVARTGPPVQYGTTPASQGVDAQRNDPFPTQPGYAPQKPLSGTLKPTITMADLVGKWDQGAGSVQRYIDSYTGDYAGTSVAFYGEQYVIKSDGSFDYLFVGRSSNHTVKETDSGTVILSGSSITFKFRGRMASKFQLIALNIQPSGAAILSLVPLHDTFQGYDAAGMKLECGHGDGFIRCVGGEQWARLRAKPAK